MRNINKTLTLLAILIILTPIALFAQTAKAQTIPTPSVSQFTVEFVDRSYDVPKTSWTTTDPNTGKQSTMYSGGNHIVNRTIDVTITNQPFNPIPRDNGTIQIYFNVRAKGHYEEWLNAWGGERMMKIAPQSSSGSTTTVTFVLGSMDPPYYDITEGKEDFQVKAIAGAYEQLHPPSLSDLITGNNIIFKNYTESDWSNIQTIDVPANTPRTSIPESPSASTSTPTSIPTPTLATTATNLFSNDSITLPLNIFAVIIVVIVLLIVALSVVTLRNYRRTTNKSGEQPCED
jgi:hypothetical protein